MNIYLHWRGNRWAKTKKALRSLSTPQSLIYICMPIKSAIKTFHILCCHIKYYIYILCMCHSISFSFSLQIRSMVCGWACARKSILSTHRYSLRTKREKEIVTPKTVIEPIGKYFKSLANWRKKNNHIGVLALWCYGECIANGWLNWTQN